MSTKNATRKAVEKPRALTMPGAGTSLETAEQRANYFREMDQAISSGAIRDGLIAMQAERLRARYKAEHESHVVAFEEWVSWKGKFPTNENEAKRYRSLCARFGDTPSDTDVHINRLVTEVLADMPQGEFIAGSALPLLTVAKRSDSIQSLDRAAGKQAAYDDTRAPGAGAKRLPWALGGRTTYTVANHALSAACPDEVQANADDPIKVLALTARYVQETILLKREKRVATLMQTTTNYVSDNRITIGAKWDNADPSLGLARLKEIQGLTNRIRKACGSNPDTFIVDLLSAQAMTRWDDFRNRVQYVSQSFDQTLMGLIGAYVGVKNVLIPFATENTANPGARASDSDVWTDCPVLVFVGDPNPVSYAGFGFSPCTNMGTAMNWRDPDPSAQADLVAFSMDCVELALNSSAGGTFDNTIT
jgi:hypothetical protein